MTNSLWKVTINWFGELHTVWTHATGMRRVLKNTAHQLAKKGIPYEKNYIYRKLYYGDVQYKTEELGGK